MRKPRSAQPDLFAAIGHNGPPRLSDESDRVYTAVLFLRIYGRTPVFRCGREHRVGRRQVTTRQLLQLCASCARQNYGYAEIPAFALMRLGMPPKAAANA